MSEIEETAGNRTIVEEAINIPFVRRGVFVYPVATLVVCGFLFMAMARTIFFYVLPGQIGVIYDPFMGGTQTLRVSEEGLKAKFPWSSVYVYDVRMQNSHHTLHALSAEGMSINIELSVLFRPTAAAMGQLHKEFGPQYRERIIGPLVISSVREVFSRYNSHALYTTDFPALQGQIAAKLRSNPISNLVEFNAVLITRLELPAGVVAAIERKLEQEQIAASYGFVLESQRAEAERKRIEAIGIQNFYAIVSSSLTESLLTWRGIEATVELARSPNAKIVVVGSGKDQLPIILGGEVGQLPSSSAEPISPLPSNAFPLTFPAPTFATPGLDRGGAAQTGAEATSSTYNTLPSADGQLIAPVDDGRGSSLVFPGEDRLPTPNGGQTQ